MEEFNESQIKMLEHYVTNTSSNIFALRNLPEVIKGALFSRYSRSNLGLRGLLLKEFISNDEETFFSSIVGDAAEAQSEAIKKARSFYDRILDGYGDDSIGELGGAHIAIEKISMLAAKIIEDCRIGGSPLEKSTRYLYFDQKEQGEYQFYKEPILMASAYREDYLKTSNMLFETYSTLLPRVTEFFESVIPKSAETSQAAYCTSIRAKVLDCLRGLLPVGALTNMGLYGNGRFFDNLIRKLHCQNLAELQEIGKSSFEELSKIIPSFIKRADESHIYCKEYVEFKETMLAELNLITERHTNNVSKNVLDGVVNLIDFDEDAVSKVAAAILFSRCNCSLKSLMEYVGEMGEEDVANIIDAACNARENRRHKSPRSLENANFTFEIIADFGCYRDLHRHRILTQERQLLSCDYGYDIPDEIMGTPMEKEYCNALDEAKKIYDLVAKEFPEEAQYIVPMAYKIRWYFNINLRALQWLCELRSVPAGHSNYRRIAQNMAKAVCEKFPVFEPVFKFVDYNDYSLGRLSQEQKISDNKTN